MGTSWIYEYKNHTIVVKNAKATELYVDNELQDRKTGLTLKADLNGKLASGEVIKVSLGGFIDVECNLFIDNVLQTPIRTEN